MLPERIDGFRIGELLGKGGMGEVYRAYDEKLERWVAIKVVRADVLGDRTARERFLREARTAAQLNHAAIVRIYHILERAEQDCIVMELLEGETLLELLRDGPLDLEYACHLAREIAAGLAAAHAKGIVHRDLKAENVIVTAPEHAAAGRASTGHAKILDFGLAKWLRGTTDLSAEGSIMGTLHCMSPEQAQVRKVDHRTDIFSFGVLLYQTLTGQAPFLAGSAKETLARVCVHRQTPAHQVNPRIPRALSALIDDLLEKDPNHRPQTAREVASTLESVADRDDSALPDPVRSDQRTLELVSGAVVVDSPRRQVPERHPVSSGDQSSKASILYVDDEESNLILFDRVFEDVYEIHTARSALEAIQVLRRRPVRLVITDQRMPGMTGVQLLEAIRSEFPDAVRIILTGYSDVDAIIKAINTGRVYQYVTKPWEEQELKVVIDRALESYELQQRNLELLEELKQKVAREKEIRRAFQRYVPPAVVDSLLDAKSSDRFLGESRIVAVLYSDVHNISNLSARLSPAQMVAFLNRYLSVMHNIVALYRGTVRDTSVSVFGAPVSSLNNAENAVLAALEMLEALAEFNGREAMDLVGEEISIGLGIHLGEVVAGNIGSDEKMEYAVVGDTVNVAARIGELGRKTPNSVLISSSVYDRTRDLVEAEALEPVVLRGRSEATPLYKVTSRGHDG